MASITRRTCNKPCGINVYSIEPRYQLLSTALSETTFSVLVADDDLRVRESLRDLLEVYDFQCQLAEDGQQALDCLAHHFYDLVLLDLKMPNVNGHQVLQEIYQHYHNTGVIILSGDASFENAREAFRMGACDFLNKPYDPNELIELIYSCAKKDTTEQSKPVSEISSISDVEKTLMELEALIESEEQALTNDIINSSPAVAFLWKNSANWPVQFVSENVKNLLGYSATEFITGKVIFNDIIHPDDVERVNHRVTDDKQLYIKHEPYRIISKFGAIKWIDESFSVIRDEQGKITHFQGILIDITDREIARQELLKSQQKLEHIAHHDPLTGLPNRLLLVDRLQQSIKKIKRVKKQLALLYIDLDKFKEINDSLGHGAGDEVLKLVARRLKNSVRDEDTVARIGGDEFVVLMESLNNVSDVEKIAQKLNSSLQESIQWNMHELFVTSSIGISLSHGDTIDAEELMKKADLAMYQSKERGRNTYQFYDG